MSEEPVDSGREHWVEAEQWLNHYYPEHEWEAWHYEDTVIIVQLQDTTSGSNTGIAQTSQKTFREWVSMFGFNKAMNYLLAIYSLMHWYDLVNVFDK